MRSRDVRRVKFSLFPSLKRVRVLNFLGKTGDDTNASASILYTHSLLLTFGTGRAIARFKVPTSSYRLV